MRSREHALSASALYDQMGMTDCVADSPARYVEIAATLGTDREARAATREKILSMADVLFENPTGVLKPGLFVRIRLPIGTPYKAVLIPDEALLSDQGRKYVYVVNNKNEVVYRPVSLGQEIQGLRVIKKGLSMGEKVIVSGMQRVRQGAEVSTKDQKPPKAPPSPLARLLTSAFPSQAAKKPDKEAGGQGEKETKKEGPGSAQAGN